MTDILCKWLNEEVKLSRRIEKSSLAQDFSTGYFLGEILHKHQLQNDFDGFSTGQTADAKLNNFTRVEPTLHLLQIPFDSNVAYDIMMLKHGIATRLLYQLYIALQRKSKNKLTGVAMETMRASAPVNLERIESNLYQQRLKTLVPRETDLKLKKVALSFTAKKEKNDRRALDAMYREAEAYSKIKEEQRLADLEKTRIAKQKQTELLAKIQAATVHIPKPPPSKTLKAINQRREMRRKREATESFHTIESFEKHLKKLVAPEASRDGAEEDRTNGTVESSVEYLLRIKNRLEEDATAREERAKRRRKVLVDQMKAHQAQEEALRQEQVVQRLMRQSTQEKRIAVQLMQTRRKATKGLIHRASNYFDQLTEMPDIAARHEKDVIRKNRIFLEKQHEARRLKDFQEAMDREKELCLQAKADYQAELEREREVHERLMNEKAQNRYRRHYEACGEILGLIVDFSCKIAEYRELTERKVPDKLVREWRELLLNGQPLYDEVEQDKSAEIALAKDEILDGQDFTEYKNMFGEWNLERDPPVQLTPTNNDILGHVLHRMFDLMAPTPPPTPPPQFPAFPLKVVILGKMFSGKTTILKRLCREHNIVRLAIDQLLTEAVESFHAHEQEAIVPRSSETLQGSASDPVDPEVPAPTIEIDGRSEEAQHVVDEINDGEEKKDPEKEVPVEENENRDEENLPKYSNRALLGKKAMSFLNKGEAVADETLVDILVGAIRKLPSGVGWALDGFPTTAQQAVMLEKALTGRDPSASPSTKSLKKKSGLVSDPKPKPEPVPYVSGIDMVVLVDVTDDIVLKRAHGRTEAKNAGQLYHEEFRPPPPGSQTGQGKVEQVISVEDPFFDKEQVQHRIASFRSNWPELKKLYQEITTICRVDGEVENDEVYSEVEQCFIDTVEKLDTKPEAELIVTEEDSVKQEPVVSPPLETKPEDEEKRPLSVSSRKSKDSGGSGDKSRKNSPRARSKDSSKGEKKKGKSRSNSSKSPKGKKKTPSPAPPPEPVEEPVGPPPPEPGTPDWVYVDEPISLDLVRSLVPYWENTEKSFVKNMKFTLRQIRNEREDIIRYLHQVRVDFQDHLKRPDHKQIFVAAWQKDFNELSDELRSDEESKAELHQRLDDLRERLWDICDTRKEQMENERTNLMEEGWIEDHLGILTNHYLTIMQAEVDRFQDTVQILKDYYGGMQSRIPVEVGPVGEFIRMPLVELDVADLSASVSAATLPSETASSAQQSPAKQHKKSSEEFAGQEVKEEGSDALHSIPSRTKIPLIQRGGSIAPQSNEDGGKGKKKLAANPAQETESPTADESLEEKTISDAFNFAANLITSTIQSRISEKEAEEEEDKRLKEEEEKAKAALLPVEKKGKSAKGGNKSSKGKKGAKKSRSPTPFAATPVEESEEEKKKKEIVIRLRDEYFAALHQEETNVKQRLDLIKNRAQVTLSELKSKTEQSFVDMNEWLGARYLREMAAVDALTTYVRKHIEDAEKLKLELKLEQDEFVINNERKLIKSPVPPPRPPPVEVAQPDTFTVVQLRGLFAQFQDVAPGGVIMSKAFVELLADTAALSYGFDFLPDMWMSISYSQLVELCGILSPQSEYIDWRKFLLLAAQPWPKPTVDQLLKVRNDFVNADLAGNGWITKDQYDNIDLWFFCEDDADLALPEDDEDPLPYNRNRNLRDFFFQLFSDWEQSPPRLDYINMLIYFAADKDNLTGFFRALSVASGEPMPKFSMVPDLLLYSGDNEISPDEALPPDFPMEQTTSFKRIHIELDPYPTPHISTESWWLVLHHGSSRLGDSHRFSMVEDPEERFSMSQLRSIYKELGSENGLPLPIQILVRHSIILEAIESTKRHKLPDIRSIFVSQALQALEIPDAASESFVAS